MNQFLDAEKIDTMPGDEKKAEAGTEVVAAVSGGKKVNFDVEYRNF